jgi:hypothetical protein
MEKIDFKNGITKVNETTFNKFQDNVNATSHFLKLTSDVAKRRNNNNTMLLQGGCRHIRCILYG